MAHIIKNPCGNYILRDDWDISDIIDHADDRHIVVSEEQALRIMEYIVSGYNPEIGINWEVVDMATDAVLGGIA